jgi:hypothetical protein
MMIHVGKGKKFPLFGGVGIAILEFEFGAFHLLGRHSTPPL